MLNQIKMFFEQYIELSSADSLTEENLKIACAALFVEMMYMDQQAHAREHDAILSCMQSLFALSQEQAVTLISLANQQRESATDYYQFTSLINKAFTQEQKISLIKNLWQIAYADGELDKYEEYLVRKMAGLLHVPHIEFIKAKNHVEEKQR